MSRHHRRDGTNTFVIAAGVTISLVFMATTARADVTISSHATANIQCTAGVCTATAKNAVLNVTALENLLASSSVKVATASATDDIRVSAALSWVSSSRLTLDAHRSILIDKPVSDGGSGGLALITNDGSTGGMLLFVGPGAITFLSLSNSLTIDGAAYTLVNSIATLASGIAADPSGDFALARSYNAKPDGIYAAAPVPTHFSGSFTGLGNTISHLSIADTVTGVDVGLFADVLSTGSVANLNLTGAIVKGGTASLGGLVGQNVGLLLNDSISGKIGAANGSDANVGGLAGFNFGTMILSNSAATVTGGNNTLVGGVAGGNDGTFGGCFATGAVAGGNSAFVGGLVGENDSLLGDSYATGQVKGGNTSEVGGLVGYDYAGAIANVFAMGSESAGQSSAVGGLIGETGTGGGSVMAGYATGVPTGGAASGKGGVVGQDESSKGSFKHVYWDTTTSGIVESGCQKGCTGATTAALQGETLPTGFTESCWESGGRTNYPLLETFIEYFKGVGGGTCKLGQ